jgi:hypothetical protein
MFCSAIVAHPVKAPLRVLRERNARPTRQFIPSSFHLTPEGTRYQPANLKWWRVETRAGGRREFARGRPHASQRQTAHSNAAAAGRRLIGRVIDRMNHSGDDSHRYYGPRDLWEPHRPNGQQITNICIPFSMPSDLSTRKRDNGLLVGA